MNRLRTRWTAWPAALLLVLSLSGVAGAAALMSNGPAAPALENSAVAKAIRAALAAEEEDTDGDADEAPKTDEDADTDEDVDEAPDTEDADVEDEDSVDAESLPTAEDLAACATDTLSEEDLLPRDGESHGQYVSRIAHSDATGPNGNHGFCVSAAARGLFEDAAEEASDAETATVPTAAELAECATDTVTEEDLLPRDGESHGQYVSRIAGDVTIVGGDPERHGFCVSAAARGLFEEAAKETSDVDATEECQTAAAHGNGNGKSKRDRDVDVEDQDADDASATCTDGVDAKADKAKKDKPDKADKARKDNSQKGKRRGLGHRP